MDGTYRLLEHAICTTVSDRIIEPCRNNKMLRWFIPSLYMEHLHHFQDFCQRWSIISELAANKEKCCHQLAELAFRYWEGVGLFIHPSVSPSSR